MRTPNVTPVAGPASRFASLYAPLLAFLLPLTVYVMTMARGLVWGDGIELASVAATLGIAHPTGYPLFTMAGHVLTWLPMGSVYWRVTLLCALAMAGSALIVFHILRSLGEALWSESFPSATPRSVLALAGALAFAWSFSPWDGATLTEVYGFELLFQLGLAALGLRVARTRSRRAFLAMAFLFGLGLTHHMLTLVALPFLAVALIGFLAERKSERGAGESGNLSDRSNRSNRSNQSDQSDQSDQPDRSDLSDSSDRSDLANRTASVGAPAPQRSLFSGPFLLRLLLPAAGLFLLGLAPLLYLPIRAAQSPALNWGNPSSPAQLLWTLRGGEFRQYRFLMESPGRAFTADTYRDFAFRRAEDLVRFVAGQLGTPAESDNPLWAFMILGWIAFFVLGFRRIAKRFPPFAVGLALAAALYLFFLFTYNILDIRDYELGFHAYAWIAVWVGIAEIPRWGAWEWRRVGETERASRVVVLALAIPVAALLFNYRAADRSGDEIADQYAVRLLKPLPENAILLTAGDNDIYSAWYLQEVEKIRPDVLVYGSNFILNSWYKEYFTRREMKGRRVGVAPGRPTTDVAFVESLSKHVIEPNIGEFPVYTTLDIPAFRAAYSLEPVQMLLSKEEYQEAVMKGEYPPPPVLYKVGPRKPGGR